MKDSGGPYRCILPTRRRTERHFLSRTELFVGPGHHPWARSVYGIRSAVEHLNDRLAITGYPTEREAKLAILRHTHESQELARDCLPRILTRPGLLSHFRDDTTLDQFWETMTHAQRARLWGDPFKLAQAGTEFDPELATLDE